MYSSCWLSIPLCHCHRDCYPISTAPAWEINSDVKKASGPVTFTPLLQMGSLKPACPAPVSIPFGAQARWIVSPLFLRLRRQNLNGLERGAPSFPTVE